jgi:L-rhamnose isomerase
MNENDDNWITGSGFEDLGNYSLYNAAFYFTVTTIVTVGYGDITAKNLGERIFCIFLMFFGVFTFSFGTGIIASIISSYDQ